MNPHNDDETGSDGMDRWFYGGTPPAADAEPDVDEAAHDPATLVPKSVPAGTVAATNPSRQDTTGVTR